MFHQFFYFFSYLLSVCVYLLGEIVVVEGPDPFGWANLFYERDIGELNLFWIFSVIIWFCWVDDRNKLMTEKFLTALAEKGSVFKNLIWWIWMKISEFHALENNPVPLATAINGTLAVKGLLNQWTSWIKSVVSEV